ncbi:MAG: molybdopterin-synthase adenylyltransferase MoeB [Thiomicrospira sp.]|uniref:HesA/MoeB/ThiF family protein n=1 Tax=Thiomicrospira sp. TaxID=935 RepID=UPI0019E712B9|nr:molybdopterin-synthase adenylyltransferase MoeB [Thiomicrospira sp.]MBE0493973.1 molybdopterin-synthase adenylyltransferase MoeB [Thiomicrospira sp.]
MTTELNDNELARYSRQILLPEIDYSGQLKLAQSHALIIGLGGLGSPVAMYLASAGVGQLTLVDFDEVDESNLQRQVIHTESRLGLNKAESAAQSLRQLNHNTQLNVITHQLDAAELAQQIDQADIVLDCSDNFDTRFALNQACFKAHKPLVSGAAIRWEGQLTTYDFRDRQSPCYECLYKRGTSTDQTCSQNGVVAPLVGMVGSMQALEAIKALVGLPTLMGKLMLIDGLSMSIRQFNLNKDPGCQHCGD